MLEVQKKSLKVGKRVGTAHVNNVIRNYKQERWVHNSKRIGKEDSLSGWYSIEELEEFLALSKENGADGMKIYFGVYDKDYKEEPLYAGRQTIVLVATKQKETASGVSNKDVYIQKENGSDILAYNASVLCPPFCGTGNDGGKGGIGITIIDKGDDGMVIG